MYNRIAKILIIVAILLNFFTIVTFINGLRIEIYDLHHIFPKEKILFSMYYLSLFSLSIVISIILIPVNILYWRHLKDNAHKQKMSQYTIVNGALLLLIAYVAYWACQLSHIGVQNFIQLGL